jgi:hypothetical protein
MDEREFSEVELRGMISEIRDLAPARRPGRFVGLTRFRDEPWVVILEPDSDEEVVFVVTAYPRGKS